MPERIGNFKLRVLNIHRHVYKDRTRPPAYREVESLLEQLRKLLNRTDLPRCLRDRLRHADDVALLKAKLANGPVPTQFVTVDLTGDEDSWRRVEVTTTDACQQVDSTGTAGGHRDTGYARDASGGISRKRCGLLVMHADDADLLELIERVEHVRDHAAGQLIYSAHAAAVQVTRDIVRRLDHHVCSTRVVARGRVAAPVPDEMLDDESARVERSLSDLSLLVLDTSAS